MKTFSHVVTVLSRLMYAVAGAALTSMMFLTVADVILRIFKRPIVGAYDLVGLLGAIVIGFSIPQTSRIKGHVLMDFLTGRLPRWARNMFCVITRLLAIATFVIIGWNVWLLGEDYRRTGEVTLTIQVPLYPVAYGIAICCFIECLVLFVDLMELRQQETER